MGWTGRPSAAVYPRVGGGTSYQRRYLYHIDGLSPRGRGNRILSANGLGTLRSIPAWAGEPPINILTRILDRVYPRVGGGTDDWRRWCETWEGLSPRGRGNLGLFRRRRRSRRSIPAWAGEPSIDLVLTPWYQVYPRVGGGT